MADMTNYLENALVNGVLRNTAYTPAATVYVGLMTAITDGETGSITEVSGGAYARQAITFDAPSDGATANSSEVAFPTATAAWGTVTGFGIFDAATAGNMLLYSDLTASKAIDIDDTARFAAGALTVAFA